MGILSIFKIQKHFIKLSSSFRHHSISIGYTGKQERRYPNDTIYIKFSMEEKGKTTIIESQMTAGEALIVSGALVQLASAEIETEKKEGTAAGGR
jgi:hypothetical protein